MPLVSIQLNSNRPEQIRKFFDSIEATAEKPEDIEVLLHIDEGDTAMEAAAATEKSRRRFQLRVLQTDIIKGYPDLWKPLNNLWELTHPDAYFVINLSDEILFETKGWDATLRQYIGYYPDHLFRLRGSKYRYRNYWDFWECGFAPDSMAFYTRKWLELSGDWNPCLGPDSYQQTVAFYLFTSDKGARRQHNRDIPLPGIRFAGEGANVGLKGEALYRRITSNNRAWFILMSHPMQQEAKRRAMRMKAYLVAQQYPAGERPDITEEKRKLRFVLTDAQGTQLAALPYRIPRWKPPLLSLLRAPLVHYYAGGGRESLYRHPLNGVVMMLSTYLPNGWRFLTWLVRQRQHVRNLFQPMMEKRSIAVCRTRMRVFNRSQALRRCAGASYEPRHSGTDLLSRSFLAKKVAGSPPMRILLNAYVVFAFLLSLVTLPPLRKALPRAERWLHLSARTGYRNVKRYVVYANNRLHTAFQFISEKTMQRLPSPISRRMLEAVEKTQRMAKMPVKNVGKKKRSKVVPILLPDIQASPDGPLCTFLLMGHDERQVREFASNVADTADDAGKIKIIAEPFPPPGISMRERCRALLRRAAPQSRFICFLSAPTQFTSHDWDAALAAHATMFDDGLFRLRASGIRYHNYLSPAEAVCADTLTFMTRKWLSVQGDDPCFDDELHVSQQLVAYELFASDPFSHTQYHRDIPLPLITAEQDLVVPSPKTFSPSVLQEARRRASLIKAFILSGELGEKITILDYPQQKRLELRDGEWQAQQSLYYR